MTLFNRLYRSGWSFERAFTTRKLEQQEYERNSKRDPVTHRFLPKP